MLNRICLLLLLILIAAPAAIYADSGKSTRIVDPNQHAYGGDGRYPYRQKSDYVMKELDLKAGDVVKEIAPIIDGGGGGRPQMAQAGGKSPQKIDEALAKAAEIIKQKLSA